jgi:hypothetical protein
MTNDPPVRSSQARKVWTFIGLVLAIGVVAALSLSVVGTVAYRPLALRHREFTAPITSVVVHVSSGDVTVEASSGIDTGVATTGVHGLTSPTDQERVVGHTLVISSSCGSPIPFDNRCTRNYVLRLRSEVRVSADSDQGSVDVTGMDGAVSVHSGQGDVTITGGSGTLQASSGQGSVTVSRSVSTSVSVHSGQGDVAVDLMKPPTRVSASSGQGAVTVGLPRGASTYRVQAVSGEGSVVNRVGNNPASSRVIDASSGQGDVSVGYSIHGNGTGLQVSPPSRVTNS